MKVKIDTKEKFHVITIEEPLLSANMTEDLENSLSPFLQKGVKNLILSLKNTQTIEVVAGEALVKIQQNFYDHHASFVICELQPPVEQLLEESALLELMNITPTESEAWDIVQMEEIERELLGGES